MDNCRVLIIEDHLLVREALVSALSQLEFPCEFSVAACGKDALALIEGSKEFDLVLVDLMLPDISGFSLVSVLAHRSDGTGGRCVRFGGRGVCQARAESRRSRFPVEVNLV